MTSTEIAIRQPGTTVAVTERDVVDGWITVIADVAKLADHIAETDFVPRALRNRPAAVAACILTGRELGIGPMASLKSIHMVQGVPSLSAEYKRARAMAAGHEVVIDESNATRCVIRGRRRGEERWVTITWTLDMAKRAKLAAKDVWQQYPQRMLQARASSELCDLIFPDATLGLETTEILEDGGALAIAVGAAIEPDGETPAAAEPKPARTAQRRQRATATQTPEPAERPTPAPAAPATAGASAPRGPAQTPPAPSGLPPLPGEEAPPLDDLDYDTPGTVTRDQVTKIQTVYSGVFGFTKTERDQQIAATEQLLGAELGGRNGVKTHNALSRNQASALIDTLAQIETQLTKADETPRDALTAFLVRLAEANAAGGQDDGGTDG